MNILQAMDDPELFRPWFKPRWLRGDTWAVWRVFLKALYALPMDAAEVEIFRKHTGRTTPPTEPFDRAWLVCGRRSGKSRIAALISTYNSVFREYPTLQRGEYGVMPIIASDKKQASVIFDYVANFFHDIPLLAKLVVSETKDSLELSNNIHIEVHASDYRSVRGYSMIGGCLDELSFWKTDERAVSPDTEILNAIEKGSANIPGAMLLGVSSPYARAGVLFEAHERNFGKDTDELCWVGDTRSMNPTISQKVIDRAYAKDPAAAGAEYGAQFRSDLANFLTPEAIAACIAPGCYELPPRAGQSYYGFVDTSGASSDAMTLAIGHRDKEVAVLDLTRSVRPPFSPESAVAEFCTELKRYSISTVHGDRYGGQWPIERFQRHGVAYAVSEKTRSEIYLTFLPALNSGEVRLLDLPQLKAQLAGLVRRTRSGGKDVVDHKSGQHDDLANSACGALVLAGAGSGVLGWVEWVKGIASGLYQIPPEDPQPATPRMDLVRKTATLQFEQKMQGIKPVPSNEMFRETVPPCEKCGAVCVVKLASKFHCNQCAFEWPMPNAIRPAAPPSRADLFSGRFRVRGR